MLYIYLGYFWMGANGVEILCCAFLLWKLRYVRDDYGINKELRIVCAAWIITTLAVLVSLLLKEGVFSFLPQLEGDTYLLVYAGAMMTRNTIVFIASVCYPVCRSYSAAYATLWSNCDALRSLNALLKDIVCVQYFRQFLIREAHAEYILCWVEIELFKDCDDLEMLRSQALRIYDKYLCEDAELEVLVSLNVRNRLAYCLEQEIPDVNRQTFDEVQQELFDLMSPEFTRFLASESCSQCLRELEREENLRELLEKSQMI